ncbi:MAG: Crp/Fnr family transcriptional regulator, partial [Bacilli bacterium]
MEVKSIFEGIEEEDIKKMLKCFDAKTRTFKKDRTIVTNIINIKMIGIILEGTANMEKYDYNGNRSIIEKLEKNSVFGEVFSRLGSDISVIATSDCEVLFIEYEYLIKRCKKGCIYHSILTNNVLQLLSKKIVDLNKRLEILSKRTIRDKLLSYFELLANNNPKRSFNLPFTYTDLADYLSIDRSAMMREIKNLKEEGFIETNGKKITLKS